MRRITSILEVNKVNKTYSDVAFQLKNISFNVPYGSVVGFIGANGAGKTTIMEMILNMREKDSGVIRLFGEEVNEENYHMKDWIGVVFDQMHFAGRLNVSQLANVCKYLYRQWNETVYFNYIQRFRLPLKENIKGFSRGMTMKLSLAVALSHDARFLLLDEATAGLDTVAREDIMEVLADYARDEQRGILLSSHMMSDMEKLADELVFIKQGEIILQVNKQEVLHHYAIVQCKQEQLKHINQQFILAYLRKEDHLEVLVEDKMKIPSDLSMKHPSLEEVSLILMKGEHNERTRSTSVLYR